MPSCSYAYASRRDLHSFPTRRSSDLMREERHDVHRLHHAGGSVPGLVRVAIAARDLSARRERCSGAALERGRGVRDRKSTRLNSSHEWISYAVFCLKKKKNYTYTAPT